MLYQLTRRPAGVSQSVAADAGRNSSFCVVHCCESNGDLSESSLLSCVFHIWPPESPRPCFSRRLLKRVFMFFECSLCVCVCVWGFSLFFWGGVWSERGIFPKWSHIWTTPPSPREQFMMMFECRRGARVTIGGREEWKQFGWKLNANTCASGGDVTLSWIKADTKTPCMRRRRPLITALLCLLSVMSPGSPLNPALGYWMNVSLHNSELLKPTPA